ncbi:type I polyketide synthase [Sandaracinus amylolyticus]|uniref:Omega-3 polyunsaturated fatty acid synthase subunit, PfaA n=1 Tax=Sandaracinus amylolyticus TaxID=927083 RepID=A0A0F6W1R0_9BACT|nr:type I polyketide synthase [Sandaracinus amylolyticus]AKF05205.1 omega-3 polyunsaturated fatty acid synthase subunit, PfaA [Sandaracinus amylolyticus]
MKQHHEPIAIVGVSALFPGSVDHTGFWHDILAGRDLLRDIPASHWLIEDYYDPDPSKPDKTYAKRGAFLDDVDFDPLEWGIPPSIVPQTDTTQLLGLIVAQKVLDDACQGQFSRIDRSKVSCILGVTSGQELMGSMVSRLQRPVWTKALRESGIPESQVTAICDRISSSYTKWEESNFPGLLGNVVAGRIANRLDIGGTNCVTDAACASTFSALSMAVNELSVGQSDLVIAGGCDTMNDIFMYMCFSKTPALSASGDCRPFSDKADGTMLGEGLGMLALKRLSDAEAAGDRIYAVIQGVGSSSDGRAKSVYAPVPAGQAKALRRAYEVAGYAPTTVELVEAHGTGTRAGDAAEFEGLRTVFSEADGATKQWCALGSVKSQIGHTKSAAGAAGLIKAVLALHHKVLPPTIKIDRPDPKLKVEESPFYLNTEARPWVRTSDHPRRASVSSFGFGGSNFHIAVEEYVGPGERAWRSRTSDTELVLLRAPDAKALASDARAMAKDVEQTIAENRPGMLVYLARTTQESFVATTGARLAIVASDEADLAAKLKTAAEKLEGSSTSSFSLPNGVHFEQGSHEGKVAFLFPGQGSQYLRMGLGLATTWDAARAPWDEAAELGLSLHDVVYPKAAFDDATRTKQRATLTATENAQPAIGAASLSALRLLASVGLLPAAVAGHSFGEVIALHAAGAISSADALRIAKARGERMAEAARTTEGAMSAVIASADAVRAAIAKHGLDVVIANHNAPDQSVISGTTSAIERAEGALRAEGLTVKRLEVATAFHSPVVAAAAAPFASWLEGVSVKAPSIAVYADATAAPYGASERAVRETLGAQLAAPVRFVEIVEAMYADGVRTFVEVGPGSVLTGLVSKILAGRPHRAIATDRKGETGIASWHHALGKLAVAGLPLQLGTLWSAYAPALDPRSKKKPKLALKLNGSNYDKPYPPKGGAAALPQPNPEKEPEVRVVEKIVERIVEVPVPVSQPTAAASHEMSHNDRPKHAPVPATNSVALPAEAQLAWIGAFQEAQRATAEAHAAFQRSMADAHAAFLKSSETSFIGLASMLGAGPVLSAAPIAYAPAPVLAPQPVAYVPPPATITQPQPIALPNTYAAPVAAPAPVAPAPVVAVAPVVAAPVVAVAPAAANVDLMAVMLDVVAAKTGYPSEMIQMGMELEADLGIDSIKRVEILAAVREKAPGLPDLDPAALGALRTVGEIVDHLKAHLPSGSTTTTATTTSSAPSAAPSVDLMAVMLSVVAAKTGYPAEMIQMGMELEADLGIDSIKRVEILAAVREQAPGLPDLDPAALGALRTVGEIVDHLKANLPGGSTTTTSTTTTTCTTTSAGSSVGGVDLMKVMLEVVAAKTGYPAEMIQMEMELEADLGIDSIKRVEILAAVREQAPGLPDLDPAALGALRTVGEIVDHLKAHLPGGAPVAAAATTSAPTKTAAKPALGRYVTRAVAAPASGLLTPGLLGASRVVITDEGTGIATALVGALASRGLRAEVVRDVPADADAVIVLAGVREAARDEDAIAINREAFRAAKAVASTLASKGGAFVTVQDTGGDFGLSGSSRAWLAGLSALVKTAAQEWPKAHARAIDLERGGRDAATLAARIADELVHGGPELEVGLRASGERLTLVSERVAVSSSPSVLEAGSVVVASGGARGVTAATLIALARETKCKLVLLGRTALEDEPAAANGAKDDAALKRALLEDAKKSGQAIAPAELGKRVERILANREVRGTIEAIRAAGGDAKYVAIDVQDAAAVSKALDEVRASWGPIAGLVHGAGVLADRFIADKTQDQFDRVFDTKIEGLRALLAATSSDPLKAVVFFSSVAARCGNQGQCDYAMANEVLNKIGAKLRRERGVRVKSLGWGPWEGGMVTPALKARFEKLGVPLIGLADGAKMLVDELGQGAGDDVELVLGGEPRAEALVSEPGAAGYGKATEERALDIVIDRAAFPFIASHVVKGTPVFPAVMAIELFARAARTRRSDLVVSAVRELKVLRGIRLAHYETTGDRFTVTSRLVTNGSSATYEMALVGEGGVKHYTAKIEMEPRLAIASASAPALGSLTPWSDIVYGDVLFHGPLFHAIRSLEGESERGIAGTLVGLRELGWSTDDAWASDPALLDGGLQLAVLWVKHALKGASLPTSIGAYVPLRAVSGEDAARGPFRVVASGRAKNRDQAVFDVVFSDASGAAVAKLEDVEVSVLPGSRQELEAAARSRADA